MELALELGAYEGNLDPRSAPDPPGDLRWRQQERGGLQHPQPVSMSRFTYNTGASEVTLTGLANANFAVMDFESGAGPIRWI